FAGAPARLLYASDEEYERCMTKRSTLPAPRAAVDSDYLFRRRDGTTFTGQLRSTLVKDPDGAPAGFVGVIQDLTENLRLDEERRRAIERLDTALETITEGFAIFDRDERLVLFNSAYRRLCGGAGPHIEKGMTAEEIMHIAYDSGGYRALDRGSPEAARWLEERLAAFRNPPEEPRVFPYGPDGWLRAEDHKAPDGNTIALRVDVSAMKKTELALEMQRREHLALLQNIPDLVGRFTRDRRVLFVNTNYAAFFGSTPEAMVGTDLLDHVPEYMREPTRLAFASVRPGEEISSKEVLHQRAGRPDTWILWSLLAVFDDAGCPEIVSVGRDISDLKREQARVAAQALELKRKNEALNQFTATVSHDLKAPLRHVAMFSEMITEEVRQGRMEELAAYADHVQKSAMRLQRLVESLLEYSQIAYQIGTVRAVPLAGVVDDALLLLEPQILESRAMITVGDLPVVEGDPELLKRLVQNLIGNAIKYRRPDAIPVLRIGGGRTQDAATFVVEDEGIGIAPRHAEKIFDVFQRLHRDETVYPGTGIGLALAKRIAESHGGAITLDTGYDGGARFVVRFPCRPDGYAAAVR
ncbi:PAS domain S-box protein, partial [Rhizobium sp. TRM95111]|uniref:ATP-binding protein n=1 Tax=Rhizobium alarense TaxID=2846851 RepID=UPI001F235E3B